MKEPIAAGVIFLSVLSGVFGISAEIPPLENSEPEVLTIRFTDEILPYLEENPTAPVPGDWPGWVRGISSRNGSIVENRAWQGAAEADPGDASFDLLVNNEILKGDLALTLTFSTEDKCDFAIQLYDDQNKVVAVDLFGNVTENSVFAGTDTYIVPMSKHATATRVSIRQVIGQLTLRGLLAFSVLSELPADPDAELSVWKLLGGELSEESRLYRALNGVISSENGNSFTDSNGKPVSRETLIKSLRAEVVRNLAETETEFEQRLIGTEWYLEDFYRRRLARFLPDGKMLQQHVEENGARIWDENLPKLERSYRVLNSKSVLFGIGGFIATFDDNFTEMSYETAGGRKGRARLVGRFKP